MVIIVNEVSLVRAINGLHRSWLYDMSINIHVAVVDGMALHCTVAVVCGLATYATVIDGLLHEGLVHYRIGVVAITMHDVADSVLKSAHCNHTVLLSH